MIWTWTVFFLIQGVGNLLWFVLGKQVLLKVLETFSDKYPTVFTGLGYNFMIAIINNFTILLLLGGLIFVYVSSQRNETPEGYYA